MEKAYELKALVEELKGKGLPVAEEAAKVVVEAVLDWVQKSAVVSDNKVDDFIAAVIPVIKPVIMEQVGKIDGK